MEIRKIKRAQPALRSRSSYLMSGGYYSIQNVVRESKDITFSTKYTYTSYVGKPGVRQIVSSELHELGTKAIVVPVSNKRKDKKVLAKVAKLNKGILDAVNKKHAMLGDFPTFNRWTPPAKYLRHRSQCDLNFSVKFNERSCPIFPERRFIRYVNTVNNTEVFLLKSTENLLKCNHLHSPLMAEALRGRIRLLKRWLYSVSLADYNCNLQRKRIRTNHFTSLKLKKLLVSLTRALSMKEW